MQAIERAKPLGLQLDHQLVRVNYLSTIKHEYLTRKDDIAGIRRD